MTVDTLFPSDNKSGTRGKRLDVETLFANAPLEKEPDITFTSDILLDKIEKRRAKKLTHFRNMLNYCYQRINEADDNNLTDIIFNVVENVPDCKSYDPTDCLEYISCKLREENIDTIIINEITMFITWKYLELKQLDATNAIDTIKSTNTTNMSSSSNQKI